MRFRTAPREDLHLVTLLPANYESVIQSALTKRVEKMRTPVSLSVSPCFFSPKEATSSSVIDPKEDLSLF